MLVLCQFRIYIDIIREMTITLVPMLWENLIIYLSINVGDLYSDNSNFDWVDYKLVLNYMNFFESRE